MVKNIVKRNLKLENEGIVVKPVTVLANEPSKNIKKQKQQEKVEKNEKPVVENNIVEKVNTNE